MADSGGGLAHDIGSSRHALHGLGTAIAPVFGYSGPNADGGCCDLALDGQYLNTGNPITLPVNAFSLEMLYWNWQRLAVVAHLAQIQSSNQIALYRTGTQWACIYNGVILTTTHNYTEQNWHHLVMTFDGSNLDLFVDSDHSAHGTASVQGNVSQLLEISTNTLLNNWGGGYFSEIAYYDHALSATRVENHFGAVDNIANVPVASGAPASSTYNGGQLDSILAAVTHVYQNAP